MGKWFTLLNELNRRAEVLKVYRVECEDEAPRKVNYACTITPSIRYGDFK